MTIITFDNIFKDDIRATDLLLMERNLIENQDSKKANDKIINLDDDWNILSNQIVGNEL